MHVHIINEWNVVSGPAEGTVSQEWWIARTHDRQWRKRKSTVLYYPRSTTEVQLYVPAVLEHSPWLSRRRDLCPNSRCHVARDDTKTYVCIYRWCVCALNARQYATLPRLTPTERHVVTYDVWVFPAHPSLCAALPDLTAAVLSSLVTAALPNGQYQCCQLSCLGCLCRWKTVSFIGEGLVCTCYQPQRVQEGQCKYRYEKADIVNNTKATQVSPYDVIDV